MTQSTCILCCVYFGIHDVKIKIKRTVVLRWMLSYLWHAYSPNVTPSFYLHVPTQWHLRWSPDEIMFYVDGVYFCSTSSHSKSPLQFMNSYKRTRCLNLNLLNWINDILINFNGILIFSGAHKQCNAISAWRFITILKMACKTWIIHKVN